MSENVRDLIEAPRRRAADRFRRGARPGAAPVPHRDEPRSLADARAVVDADAPPAHFRSGLGEVRGVPLAVLCTDLVVLVAVEAVSRIPGWIALSYAVVVLLCKAGMRQYRHRLHLSVLDQLPGALSSALVAVGVLLVAIVVSGSPEDPADLLVFAVWTTALSLVAQYVVLHLARAARQRFGPRERTLVIGAGRVGSGLAEALLDHPELGLCPIGFADPDALTHADDLPLPVVSTDLAELGATLARTRATTVLIAFSATREAQVMDTVITAHGNGCSVLVVPRMFELHQDGPNVERVRGIPLIRLQPDPTLRPTWWIKRALDVTVGLVGLAVLSPLLLLLALAVLLESGRPVLFWQERVGLDGRLFRLCKFRSLTPADEHESRTNWSVANDDRIGSVGRLLRRSSLDELAQLWNIVKGDMSLVGPRPERPTFVHRFSGEHERYWARHRVPVGLTGLAQVSGLRGDTSIQERARYDNYYIANWSLWLDLKIMLLTVRAVLNAGGR